ncbi:MAG: hypothetical protein P4M05_25225 [Bradyrhizobium sp.]|nr:hypothetical protein [Bradyrhizobium sp.]
MSLEGRPQEMPLVPLVANEIIACLDATSICASDIKIIVGNLEAVAGFATEPEAFACGHGRPDVWQDRRLSWDPQSSVDAYCRSRAAKRRCISIDARGRKPSEARERASRRIEDGDGPITLKRRRRSDGFPC